MTIKTDGQMNIRFIAARKKIAELNGEGYGLKEYLGYMDELKNDSKRRLLLLIKCDRQKLTKSPRLAKIPPNPPPLKKSIPRSLPQI